MGLIPENQNPDDDSEVVMVFDKKKDFKVDSESDEEIVVVDLFKK